MPNIAVHLLLARGVLKRWRTHPAQSPFPVTDPAAADAFLYGSVAPDAGYFPRGDRLFSELAHTWRTGALASALGEHARTAVQRAYAWGWAAHVLADLAIHPLINEANGEAVHGTRSRPLSSTDDVATHMRLEYGLDAAIAARHAEVERMRPARPLGAGALEVLETALRETWGWSPPAAWLRVSHHRARLAVRLCALTNRVHTARWRRRPAFALARAAVGVIAPPRRGLPAAWNASPAAAAILAPLTPPAWLVEAVETVAARFADHLDAHRAGDSPSVPDHDLITGAVQRDDAHPPRTLEALRELAGRGGFRAPQLASIP